ncbi:MAG: hypothetical protein HZB79_02645 [Deltaproteobacteria bacterium]|nr:hypothetical protein [Deltaproteobacteria bacterium]
MRTICLRLILLIAAIHQLLLWLPSPVLADNAKDKLLLAAPSDFYEQEMHRMIALFKERKEIKLFQSRSIRYALAAINVTNRLVNTPFGKKPDVEKIIIYNPDDFEKLNRDTGSNYASLVILAHEVGHHYNQHLVDDISLEIKHSDSNSCESWGGELGADFFAGIILGLMGASDKEIILAYTYLFTENGSYTHPDSYNRIGIVITGLHAATKQGPSKEHVDAIIGKIKAGLIKKFY